MDISLERHSADIGRRGLRSINRARAFLDRELLKGKTVCLRRAWAREEDGEENEEEEGDREGWGGGIASEAASITLLQDVESAKELFFVVEERARARAGAGAGAGAGTGPGAGTSENAKDEAAAGTSSSPSSLRSDREDAKSDYRGSGRGVRHGDDDEHDGEGAARAAAEDGDYLVPYWAILRVGEMTDDPGVTPEPWPMYGVSGNSRAPEGQHGGASLAVSRSQLPPPSQVHRVPNVPDSVGYRIVVVNVKVSIHHPRGSSVAANKDAVIDRVTRVREW